jgi:O-succinylbenzoate synthase
MALELKIEKYSLVFDFEARTSRGTMRTRDSWFFIIRDSSFPLVTGIGECGPLPGLSPELTDGFEERIQNWANQFNAKALSLPASAEAIPSFVFSALGDISVIGSSVFFALETALLDLLNGGQRILFKSSFLTGQAIPINGLIWMGGLDFMLQQVEIKIRDGFRCVKLKVGGLDFEKECDILQYIRRKYFREEITIRLDANGAFKPDEALYKLRELSKFNIHSIEQPLKTGAPELPELCAQSPIPVALDEELIGTHEFLQKKSLLEKIRPAYIILKPSLHGGFLGCHEWITLAKGSNIGWWVTSALESNIGLSAIAQFTAQYDLSIPQGLGTGMIYNNNFSAPLEVFKGQLSHTRNKWEIPWVEQEKA